MRLFLFFVSLLVPSIVAFNCNSVTSSDDCITLTGCSWDSINLLCSGNYAPACTIPNCYYVDPVNGLDTQNGAGQTPFKTLKPAFTALATKAGTIYVINLVHLQEANLLSSTEIKFTITLSALFTNKKFVLSLGNFDPTTYANPALKAAFNITANQLTVTGCAFTEKSVPPTGTIDTIFEIFNTKLYFNNVSSYDYTGSAYLVNIQASKTSSIFSHNVGNFRNTAFSFNLLTGTQTITGVNFYNITIPKVIYNVGVTTTFTNVVSKYGSSLFMNLQAQTILAMTNYVMTEYEGNFMTGTTTKYITLTSCTFENITQNLSEPFVHLIGKGSTSNQHAISTSIFRNITVRNSIFLLENGAGYLTYNNNLMTNIKKISLTKAQKTVTDLSYESYLPSGGICFLGIIAGGIRATSSNFTNVHSHCIGLYQSVISLTSCIFDNSGLSSQYESSLKSPSLTDADGVSFITFKDGTNDINPGSNLAIASNTFINNVKYPKSGGAIKFTGTFSIIVNFVANTFNGLGALYGGAVYCENPLAGLVFGSDNFLNNVAILGGAVYKSTQETAALLKVSKQTIYFDGVTFTGNSAMKKGGAIYITYETLGLYSSFLTSNTAANGGAIYFIKQNPYAVVPSKVGNNTFTSNVASNSGGAVKVLFNYYEILDNTTWTSNFTNNSDFKGLAVSDGIPSYYTISFYDIITDQELTGLEDFTTWVSNPNKTKLANSYNTTNFPSTFQMKHKSGHELAQIIHVQVFDDRNRLADYITDETILTSITDTYNNISDFQAYLASSSIAFSFSRGHLAMKTGVTLVGEPKSIGLLTFSSLKDRSNILVDANLLIKQSVQVYFIDCEVGDTYSSQTKICQTCAKGTYSLANPYSHPSCIVCDPASSICLGGSKIAPKAGYWRYSMYSEVFLKCPESSACLGGYVDNTYNPNGECKFPYEGNLCNQCAPEYAKFGTSEQCVSCTTDVMYYVKFAGLLILQILILLYGVKCNIDKVNQVKKAQTQEDQKLITHVNNSDFQSNLMKITVNFLQVSTIVIQYNFEWPKFITNMINVTNKVIPSDKNGFSIDCIIAMITGDNRYILFIKLVVTLLEPYVMWALLILSYILYLKIKKEQLIGNSKLKKNILVLFIITAFLLQPNIIQTTLEMFRCKNYVSDANPVYFMKGDSETECWTSLHLFWSLVVALPNFVFWTIFLPLALLLVLKKNAKNLGDPEIYARYSFIYEGLKKERYYWEFLILTRKTLIVIIFVFLNFVSSQSQAFATFLVIFMFSVFHYLAWPYSDERLNRAEMLSLVSLGVMVYSGMFFLSEGGTEWLNVALIIFSSAFNIVFFCYLTKHFIWSYRQKALTLRDKAKQVSKHVSKIKEKFSKLRSGSKNSSSNNTNSSMSEKKIDQSNTIDIKDLSMVLNQIESPSIPKSAFSKFVRQGNNESTDQTPHQHREERSPKQSDEEEGSGNSIPSEENERTTKRSKTVYQEEKNEVSNHSVLRKSMEWPKKSSFKLQHQDSVISQGTPDMLNEMLNLFHARRSSPTSPTHLVNSNDLPYIGRTFSMNEKKVAESFKKDDNNIFPIDEESF